MTEVSRAVTVLLTTAEECHRELADYVREAWLSRDFGHDAQLLPRLVVEAVEQSVRIDLRADVTVAIDEEEGTADRFGAWASVEVADAGFRVTSTVYARLDVPAGDFGRGMHVLHEERSAVIDLDEAMTAVRAQVRSLWSLPDQSAAFGLGH